MGEKVHVFMGPIDSFFHASVGIIIANHLHDPGKCKGVATNNNY